MAQARKNMWTKALVLATSLSALTEVSATNHNGDTIQSAASSSTQRELIINGWTAPPGRFPYFSTLNHYCGGALIAPDAVLTAGHCLPKHLDSVQPHVGRYSFHSEDDQSQVFDIVAMERHPHWHAVAEDNFRHDVSILFLNEPVHNLQYVRLNRNASLPLAGEQVTAMGVGWTSPDWRTAQKAMVLQEVHLNYLPNDQCELSTNENDIGEDDDGEVIRFEGIIHPDHMCTTGGPNNERDACAFDSGSPIILEGDGPEEDVVVALVSGGVGCADKNFPAINTRISDSIDFITNSVCKHSADPPPEFKCHTSEPTSRPTDMPSASPIPQNTTTNTTIIPYLGRWIMAACLVFAALYWMRHKALCQSGREEDDSFQWLPSLKQYKDQQYSSETEYLYQSSPASSKASSGSGASYDAIEIQDV